jgi:6-phosphogluconolactonase (cycloisomerase 2 family)
VAASKLQLGSSNAAARKANALFLAGRRMIEMSRFHAGFFTCSPVLLVFAFKFSEESLMLQKALILVFAVAGIAGGVGCSTTSHYVYATLPAANELAVYREDPFSGTLTELAGTPYTIGDGAHSVVIHPSGKFLYVANPGQNENDISLFDILSNGYLNEIPPRTTVAPNGTQPALLAMDPAGNYLYVMNTGSDNISVFSIDSTGGLTQVPNSPFFIGLTPLNMVLTPSGDFLYVSVAGGQIGSSNGSILGFSVSSGALQLLNPPLTSADGVNPNGLVIDPSGSYMYVANTQSDSISIFAISPPNTPPGTLQQVIGSPLDDIYSDPFALLLDPKGQFLYVANQGSSNVAVYSIDSTTGLPTALTTSTSAFAFTTEGSPSFLVEDPNGNYLFVGNQGSSAGIQAFGVNSGNLNPLLTYAVGNTPSSIAVAP